jgi:hypothetical protein
VTPGMIKGKECGDARVINGKNEGKAKRTASSY